MSAATEQIFHLRFASFVCFVIQIMDVKNLNEVPPFITKDGSEIRELLAHRNSCIRNQTLAEARLPVGGSTTPHYHPKSGTLRNLTVLFCCPKRNLPRSRV